MKRTLITAVTLAACAASPLLAQNTKEDVITFSLTRYYQNSASTTGSKANAGLWSDPPLVYKTKSSKLGTVDVLKAIAIVSHGAPNYFSSNAKLVLVQGELAGWFGLATSTKDYVLDNNQVYTNMTGTYVVTNTVSGGNAWAYAYTNSAISNDVVVLVTNAFPTATNPFVNPAAPPTNKAPVLVIETNKTALAYASFKYNVTNEASGRFFAGSAGSTISQLEYRLATGRHYQRPSDVSDSSDKRLAPGHDQPWGQVYVKDSAKALPCENVTYFFRFEVEECYDCFYLSSFISDSRWQFKGASGPPCCAGTTANTASGKDKYYLTVSFDNTLSNPYLNPESDIYVGWPGSGLEGIEGLYELEDGLTPDALTYDPSITVIVSGLNGEDTHEYDPYVMRFTLNGILTYTWALKMVNSTDPAQEFIGTGSYQNVSGYGFISKVCSLINGSMAFTETIKKTANCCLGIKWYNWWYGVGYPGYLYDGTTEVNVGAALTYHEVQAYDRPQERGGDGNTPSSP